MQSSDAKAHGISPWLLRFEDKATEEAFVKSTYKSLVKLSIVASIVTGIIISTALGLYGAIDWSTSGGIYADTELGRQMGERRNTNIIAMFVSDALLAVFLISCKMSRAVRINTVEITMTFIGAVYTAFFLANHHYVLCRLSGLDDNLAKIASTGALAESDIVLYMCVFLVGWTLALPIRWKQVLLVDLFIAVLSLLYIVLLSPDPLYNFPTWMVFLWTVCCVGIGKKSMETSQRIAFVLLARERTLRAQAEHQLHQASEVKQDPSSHHSSSESTPDNSSMAPSAKIFQPDGLQAVAELGKQEHWHVGHDGLRIVPGRILGEGGFGIVALAEYYGSKVAVKICRGSQMQQKSLQSVLDELRIYRRLKHPNIVGFYGAAFCPTSLDLAIVLEYVYGQPLKSVIPEAAPTSLRAAEWRLRLAKDVCCALCFLHGQTPAIIHGDIKDTNILVDTFEGRLRCRLLDFGLSRLLTRRVANLGGSLRWVAPEVLRGDRLSASPAADVFSFGRLFFMMITGRKPLAGKTADCVLQASLAGDSLGLEWPREMPLLEEARALVTECTHESAKDRPRMQEVRNTIGSWAAGAFDSGEAVEFVEALQRLRREDSATKKANKQAMKAKIELLYPTFVETPLRTKVSAVVDMLGKWNFDKSAGGCCEWHALLSDAEAVLRTLRNGPCMSIDAERSAQCPQCFVMTNRSEEQGETKCFHCGSLVPPRGDECPTVKL